jgi:cyclopropane-fatty-acyl-phospholipid synthase
MLLKLLNKKIQRGTLILTCANGEEHHFGQGSPVSYWHFTDDAAMSRIAWDPHMELGESYMEGAWHAGEGGLRRLLQVLMINFGEQRLQGTTRLYEWFYKFLQARNRITRSYRNVAHHYDLDEWLFRHFLDERMFYSCAYFQQPAMSLEQAQLAKCEIIRRKLLLEPGMTVLDIGCGWGGLAMYLAEHADVAVTGVTLSREQLRVAQATVRERGLEGRVKFLLQDYREHQDEYDRIVSVGMFEHVGRRHFPAFFHQVSDKLKQNGVALLHTIGCVDRSGNTNPWIRRHIFPGGYIPALSEMAEAVEGTDLMSTDVDVWHLHYADTLAEWYRRFQHQRDAVRDRMGERFCRMWEFYLASTEGAFRWWDLVVFQLQMAKRHDVVPQTRDYLYTTRFEPARYLHEEMIDTRKKRA